jgi:hypothetical protein
LRIKNLENKRKSLDDLSNEVPSVIVPLSVELSELKMAISHRRSDVENIISQLNYLIDKASAENLLSRLKTLRDNCTFDRELGKQVQKVEEFCDECRQNHSDEEEFSLTERISDINEVRGRLQEAAEIAEGIIEKA